MGEAWHFKFCVMIDTEKYYCTHDRLLPMETCLWSLGDFKVWETSDNVAETVHDRDIVAIED